MSRTAALARVGAPAVGSQLMPHISCPSCGLRVFRAEVVADEEICPRCARPAVVLRTTRRRTVPGAAAEPRFESEEGEPSAASARR